MTFLTGVRQVAVHGNGSRSNIDCPDEADDRSIAMLIAMDYVPILAKVISVYGVTSSMGVTDSQGVA